MKRQIRKISLAAFALASIFITSCNEDETLEREGKPTVTVVENNILSKESENVSLEFNFSYTIKEAAQVRIEVIGGTAEEGTDYEFNLSTIEDAGFGYFGGEGYFGEIPAFTSNFTLTDFLSVLTDDVSDSGETIELRISSVSKGTILINERVSISIDADCAFTTTKFVGNYLIEQLSAELDGPTLSDGSIVTLSVSGANNRSFETENYPLYCAGNFSTFTMTFDCDLQTVNALDQNNSCACADGTNYFGPGAIAETVDFSDDSEFILTFTDDAQSDCVAPGQTTYKFTKQ
jgi:hypothetical protein